MKALSWSLRRLAWMAHRAQGKIVTTNTNASRNESVASGDRRVLWPLPVILCISLFFAVLGGGIFWSESDVQLWLAHRAMAYIPSAACIAASSPSPARFAFVYGVQWLAVIPYLYYWFIVVPPWAKGVRDASRAKAASLSTKQRMTFLLGVVLLALYMLGNLGLIGFPTFFNGHFACAGERSPAILASIHDHWLALAIYGALAVFCECTVAWMFVLSLVNFRVYLFGDSLPD
ncbi:hypothetical protein [Dyella humicola]|uniref:hypothetical protein n=1 Tax=Dyella humicola TaxID=2992126 RepID=UPI00224D7592|nr:hypothetical protein [Dyella humicola]